MIAKTIVVRKSLGQKCPYGFDSHPGHKIHNTINKYFKVKQAKPDEVKRLGTEMSYGQDSR